MRIGSFLFRFRWVFVGTWIAATALLVTLVSPTDPSAEPVSFLPPQSPQRQAVEALDRYFPNRAGLSQAVVVFERPDAPLNAEDLAALETLGERVRRSPAAELREAGVRTPAQLALPANPVTGKPLGRNPMVSEDGRATLAKIELPANYLTLRATRAAERIRDYTGELRLPAGLRAAVTGSAGFGLDYSIAVRRSHERTVYVTLFAVVAILLLVFRAPLAAMVPVAAVSLTAGAVLSLLAFFQRFGLHAGSAERIFVFVLLYGAGIDYSLLFLSRYREFLASGADGAAAVSRGLDAAFPAILAAACTNIAGLLVLRVADFGVFRTTGPAAALSLGMALLAGVTLVPALTAIVGPRLFWPRRTLDIGLLPASARSRGPRLWPWVAGKVIARPALVMTVTLAALALPAFRGTHVTWVYDALASLKPSYEAIQGIDIVKRHWPIGEVAPVSVLVTSPAPRSPQQWAEASRRLTDTFQSLPDVSDVRSLSAPLGKSVGPLADLLIAAAAGRQIQQEYLAGNADALRLTVVLGSPPYAPASMAVLPVLRKAAEEEASRLGGRAYLAGATAEILDLRDVTLRDFRIVAAFSLAAIFLIILVLLRDPLLVAFMVASTLLTYFATLGVCCWVFGQWLGQAGLDWKIEVMLFVVLVAVGQDYNIFLAARLSEEGWSRPTKLAVREALVHTGPVISSCGVIMAATLGSLMAGDLGMLVQLGFAFALGMILDTFVVRPLLLPTFAVLTGRTGKAPWFR
jgi:RND superfamily putative drug exporter